MSKGGRQNDTQDWIFEALAKYSPAEGVCGKTRVRRNMHNALTQVIMMTCLVVVLVSKVFPLLSGFTHSQPSPSLSPIHLLRRSFMLCLDEKTVGYLLAFLKYI
ncbi:hypothetical protein BaRGS_00032447 [Batillaria attramentaria]|uniref:Uncharacterized protein n=1 Tax=Batillaria attramentaria TaxID=370345 RepID=A0ABD0JMT7_9CAEN